MKSSANDQWLFSRCSSCKTIIKYKLSDLVFKCSNCNRSHTLKELLSNSILTSANGADASAEDRQDSNQAVNSTLADNSTLQALHATEAEERDVLIGLNQYLVSAAVTNGGRTRALQLVRVRGSSSFVCKLVSPYLTQLWFSGLQKPKTHALGDPLINARDSTSLDLPPLQFSALSDLGFIIEASDLRLIGYGADHGGSVQYLQTILQKISRAPINQHAVNLIPIFTTGDGHCLVHAISRAISGTEILWDPLQSGLKQQFDRNLTLYQHNFQEFYTRDMWKNVIAESCPHYEHSSNSSQAHGLSPIHCQGLADLLRRPIIVLDGIVSMESSCIFLPFVASQAAVSDRSSTSNATTSLPFGLPLVLAFANAAHNHYVALVPIRGTRTSTCNY